MQAKVKPYSPKGLVVQGITAEQAESIRAALGPAVVTSHNAKLGGWVFSRKREAQIRVLVGGLTGELPVISQDMPGAEAVMADSAPGEGLRWAVVEYNLQTQKPVGRHGVFKNYGKACGVAAMHSSPTTQACVVSTDAETDSMPGEWGALA